MAWLDGRILVPREQLVDDAASLFAALGETAAGIAAGRTPADAAATAPDRASRRRIRGAP
ncbi:MAG: hypothetical protein U5R31_07105 [Acidimicrobiia bacterium]|nr:hypothetical protein [Acidimicrobiia bacterium]